MTSEINCEIKISELYTTFSPKEKTIADYLLKHKADVIYLSIDILATKIGISESTLVRFVRKLGYSNYREFRVSITKYQEREIATVFETPIGEEEDEVDIIFSSAKRTLELTQSGLDRRKIKEAVQLINESGKLLLAGMGGSNIVSQDAFHKIIRTGITCQFSPEYHMQLMLASQLEENDVVLLTSHTGVDIDALNIMDIAKSRKAKVIVITSSPYSPITAKADIILSVSVSVTTAVAESFSARIAQLMLIDVVYVELMKLRKDGISSLERMRDAIATRRLH